MDIKASHSDSNDRYFNKKRGDTSKKSGKRPGNSCASCCFHSISSGRTTILRGKRWASQAQHQPTTAAVVSFFFDCSGRMEVPRSKRWASQAQRQPTTAATLDPSKGRPHLDPPLEKGEGEQSKASLCKWDIWLPFGDLRCSLKTSIKSNIYKYINKINKI